MPRKAKTPKTSRRSKTVALRARSTKSTLKTSKVVQAQVDAVHKKIVKLLMRSVTTVREIKKLAKMLNLEMPRVVIKVRR